MVFYPKESSKPVIGDY